MVVGGVGEASMQCPWQVRKDKGNIVCVVTGKWTDTCIHWKVQIWDGTCADIGICSYNPQLAALHSNQSSREVS